MRKINTDNAVRRPGATPFDPPVAEAQGLQERLDGRGSGRTCRRPDLLTLPRGTFNPTGGFRFAGDYLYPPVNCESGEYFDDSDRVA
jgi:hypothetical protein